MNKRGIDALGDLAGARVLLRVDFNVPLSDGPDGPEVADDYRLQMALPTIEALLGAGARVVCCSHLGRPKGEVVPELSLLPVAAKLSTLIDADVSFSPETIGEEAEAASHDLEDGQLLLVENLRFHPGEKKDDPEFAQALAKLGDIYVNDAFGVCHRAHASVSAVAKLLPAFMGGLIAREIEALTPLREGTAARPFLVVMGGAKLSDKIPVLEALIPRVDGILIGGGMSYTFLKGMGKPIGRSRCDDDLVETAQTILETARQRARETGQEMLLPRDHAVATGIDDLTGYAVVDEIPSGLMALDVGPKTIAEYTRALGSAKTVFWNGPLGVFEHPPFHLGTDYVATFLAARAESTQTIVGGGDSAAATRGLGLADNMHWVSTGGGASLEYVQGEDLPGLNALPDAE